MTLRTPCVCTEKSGERKSLQSCRPRVGAQLTFGFASAHANRNQDCSDTVPRTVVSIN